MRHGTQLVDDACWVSKRSSPYDAFVSDEMHHPREPHATGVSVREPPGLGEDSNPDADDADLVRLAAIHRGKAHLLRTRPPDA